MIANKGNGRLGACFILIIALQKANSGILFARFHYYSSLAHFEIDRETRYSVLSLDLRILY